MLWSFHSNNCAIFIENTENNLIKFSKESSFKQKIIFCNHGKYVAYDLAKVFGLKFSSLNNQHKVTEG